MLTFLIPIPPFLSSERGVLKMQAMVRKAVIPAAGLGSRLLPVTKAQPKEMVPVADRPAIQWVVEEAVAAGITDIIIITGRRKRIIEDHFDRDPELETFLERKGEIETSEALKSLSRLARFTYIRQPVPLGLGDAVACALPVLCNEPFAVLLPDEIILGQVPATARLIEAYQELDAPVVGVQRVEPDKVVHYGVVEVSERSPAAWPGDDGSGGTSWAGIAGPFQVSTLVEKPLRAEAPSNLAVVGRYILVPEIFTRPAKTGADGDLGPQEAGPRTSSPSPSPAVEAGLTELLASYAGRKQLYAVFLYGQRFDVGTSAGWLRANLELALKEPELASVVKEFVRQFDGSTVRPVLAVE